MYHLIKLDYDLSFIYNNVTSVTNEIRSDINSSDTVNRS
jgi:hypothetical protein